MLQYDSTTLPWFCPVGTFIKDIGSCSMCCISCNTVHTSILGRHRYLGRNAIVSVTSEILYNNTAIIGSKFLIDISVNALHCKLSWEQATKK